MEKEHEQPRVVSLWASSAEENSPRTADAQAAWGCDQTARVRAWWSALERQDMQNCPLVSEKVGSSMAEQVVSSLQRRLQDGRTVPPATNTPEGRERTRDTALGLTIEKIMRMAEEKKDMTVGDYVSCFPWLGVPPDQSIAPPLALLAPEARRQMLDEQGASAAVGEEVPYLHDYALGQSDAGIALLRDLTQPFLDSDLIDWPARCRMGDDLRLPSGVKPFAYLFLGPRGSRSLLHTDDHSTHGWLMQIHGTKKIWLWPPLALPYHRHVPTEIVVRPGQMLYIPFMWAHEVVALEHSISIQWRYLCKECPEEQPQTSKQFQIN